MPALRRARPSLVEPIIWTEPLRPRPPARKAMALPLWLARSRRRVLKLRESRPTERQARPSSVTILEVQKMRSRLASIFVALGLIVVCAATSLGQATGGAVTGEVLDATGAVVPNATVTLRSKQTGQTLTSQTTDSGSYSFPNVPVGDYTITVENTGFAPATQELKVTLNQTTTVNATLQAAGITGVTIDVTAASE